MSTSTAVAAARDAARHVDGEFGEQNHADPGELDLETASEPAPPVVYTIPSWGKAKALAKIEKANKRLARVGITERFEAEWSEVQMGKEVRADGSEVMYEYQEMTLNHPVLSYNGWEFMASLDDTGNGMIVRARPGADLEGWRPETQMCDECGKHRARTETYVVKNAETGEMKQVGSSCMNNFLGIKPSGLWAIGYDMFEDEDQEDTDDLGGSWGGAGRNEELQDTRILIAAALIITKEGRDYRPADFEQSTSEQVKDLLWGNAGTSAEKEARGRLRAEAAALAASPKVDEVLAAVNNMKAGTDFADNMRMLAGSEAIRYRHAGLMAYSVKEWAKQNDIAQAEKAHPRKEGFLAPEKTQLKTLKTADGRKGVAVTVQRFFYGTTYTPYGETTNMTLIMQTEDGQTLKWRSSKVLDVELGQGLLLAGGSVKGHSQWEGHDQTDLQRVKIPGVTDVSIYDD